MGVLSPALIRAIRLQYTLPWRGIHGVAHWARIRETGVRRSHEGADRGGRRHPDVLGCGPA